MKKKTNKEKERQNLMQACIRIFAGLMIDTISLHKLIPVLMTMAFLQDHSCMRGQKSALPFLGKFVN